MCCANTGKRGITRQPGAEAAERRIGHHRHATVLAPWQQVIFNSAVAEVVKDLIGRAAIAVWIWKSCSMSLTLKLDTPQARVSLPCVDFRTPSQ